MSEIKPEKLAAPKIVDWTTFQAKLDSLRMREKAPTLEGDALAPERRGLPTVEVDATRPPVSAHSKVTLLDAFEARRMLIASVAAGVAVVSPARCSSACGEHASSRAPVL